MSACVPITPVEARSQQEHWKTSIKVKLVSIHERRREMRSNPPTTRRESANILRSEAYFCCVCNQSWINSRRPQVRVVPFPVGWTLKTFRSSTYTSQIRPGKTAENLTHQLQEANSTISRSRGIIDGTSRTSVLKYVCMHLVLVRGGTLLCFGAGCLAGFN